MERLPALFSGSGSEQKSFNNEREILYQVLFDMKKDMNDLKKLVHDIMNGSQTDIQPQDIHYSPTFLSHKETLISTPTSNVDLMNDKQVRESKAFVSVADDVDSYQDAEEYHELESQKPQTLEDMEKQMIKRTLEKHRGKRKAAADELQISERTLYRKIKEYGIE
jgi:DNA-binding NtrC family response regulator